MGMTVMKRCSRGRVWGPPGLGKVPVPRRESMLLESVLSDGTIIEVSKVVQGPGVPNGAEIGLQRWCNLGFGEMPWEEGYGRGRAWRAMGMGVSQQASSAEQGYT